MNLRAVTIIELRGGKVPQTVLALIKEVVRLQSAVKQLEKKVLDLTFKTDPIAPKEPVDTKDVPIT